MGKVKFGLRVPFSGPASTSERLAESTSAAEALGYDSVFAQDHIHKSFERGHISPIAAGDYQEPSNSPDPIMFESVASLAFLAGSTKSIELGIAVTPLPLRDPILLGKQLATVDAHSGGRVIFGVGVANVTDKEEFTAMGVPFRPYAERYEQAGEFVAAMRTMWENPTATYHGNYVNFEDLIVYPKPARRIPVWIGCKTLAGGIERPSVKFAVEHADGVMPPFITTTAELRSMIEDFTKTAEGAGRDISDFAWCAQRRLSIAETMDAAHENMSWLVRDEATMWHHAGYMQSLGEEGARRNIAMTTAGTPDDIRATMRDYVDAGATHFDIAFAFRTYDSFVEQMHLFAREVIPEFK